MRTPRQFALLLALAIAVSKVWLPMDRALSLPLLGELSWQTLYRSSRGPWISDAGYAIQLTIAMAITAGLYLAFLRKRG